MCSRFFYMVKPVVLMYYTPMNIKEEFTAQKNKFNTFFSELKKTHRELTIENLDNRGHGFDHDLMVAQYGLLVCEDDNKKDSVWVAGLLHSFDRLFGENAENEINRLLEFIPNELISKDNKSEIKLAIHDHDGPNKDDDSHVKMVLQDSDRLANIGSILIIRSGQFRPNIPSLELDYLDHANPQSTYNEPRSIMDDIRTTLEWENKDGYNIRLSKSKELSKKHFQYLRDFINEIRLKFEEVGLYPPDLN